jgi:hypothetical protein
VQEAPLADGRRGVKDSDGPPRRTLQLRMTADDWYDGQFASCVRVFLPRPDDPTNSSGAAVASLRTARASCLSRARPL